MAQPPSAGNFIYREWWWYLVTFLGLQLLFIEWWVYTRRVRL